jgi:predicted porin
MQKKLIVLALAGLASSAAFAQTNVTIYGVADVFVGWNDANNSTGDQSRSVLNSGGLSGSRLGFKGEEALGNGLKAIFTYEFGLDPTATDSGLSTTRQAFVGLSGNWGTVVGGRLQTVGYDWGVKYDTFAAAAFSPIGIATVGQNMSISGNNTGSGISPTFGQPILSARQPNTIGYVSPNWSGFSLKTHYSFGEQLVTDSSTTGTDTAQSIFGIGGYYDNGPLSIGLVYHGLFDIGGTANGNNVNSVDQNEWGIGASYDFKFLLLKASYQAASTDNNSGTDFDREAWAIGAGIPIGGNGKVNLAFGQATGDAKANIFGIDYEHSLSKRTTAYIGGTYLDSRKGSAQPSNTGTSRFLPSAVGTSASPSADDSAYMIGAGVRHTF